MKKVHTEIFCGKTIDVFEYYDSKWGRYTFTAEIDGVPFAPKTQKTPSTYRSAGLAAGAAKHSINLNMSKADEIKRLEEQIAELQAKLEKLRG